jgi:hypothetical protein
MSPLMRFRTQAILPDRSIRLLQMQRAIPFFIYLNEGKSSTNQHHIDIIYQPNQ